MTTQLGRQAVVIGAGIAGLTAARVLADFFDRVIVLERDGPATEGLARPGVPQGAHLHILRPGGLAALTDLLPGFGRDLEATGALPFDAGRDMRVEIPGLGVLPRRDLGLHGFAATRPAVEAVLRRRVSAWGNIVFRHGVRVLAVVTDGGRATGVHYDTGGWSEAVAADLVIDAGGRGSLTLDALAACGLPRPAETIVGVDVGYATGDFELPHAAHDFVGVTTAADAPGNSRSGCMLRVGATHLQVVLTGRGIDQPPTEPDAFRAFAETLPTSTIATALAAARPISHIRRFLFRDCVWRRFGAAAAAGGHVDRLVPLGDALCRLDPKPGLGMSVAAIEARLLRDMLTERACGDRPLDGLAAHFLRRTEHLLEIVWRMTTTAEFLHPGTRGTRPADIEARLRADHEMLVAAIGDADVHRRLAEANGLVTLPALAEAQHEPA